MLSQGLPHIHKLARTQTLIFPSTRTGALIEVACTLYRILMTPIAAIILSFFPRPTGSVCAFILRLTY